LRLWNDGVPEVNLDKEWFVIIILQLGISMTVSPLLAVLMVLLSRRMAGRLAVAGL